MIWWIIGIIVLAYILYEKTSTKQGVPDNIEKIELLVNNIYPKIVENKHVSIKEHEDNLKDDSYSASKDDLQKFILIDREDLKTYENVRHAYIALKERYKHDIQKQTEVVRDYFDYFNNENRWNEIRNERWNNPLDSQESVDQLREEMQEISIKNREILKRFQAN